MMKYTRKIGRATLAGLQKKFASMTRKKKVYKQYKVNDVITEKNTVIKCPMCHNDKFYKRFLLISKHYDDEVALECENCTHLLWFKKL